MTRRSFFRRIRQDRRGATIIEFAMILPAMCALLIAALELGYHAYASSVAQGALMDASRMATVGGFTLPQVDARVRQRLSHFADRATVVTNAQSYREFSNVGTPEPITSDTAPLGAYNAGDCYEDVNNNGRWDSDQGRTGTGNADDVVRYSVTITYPRILPVAEMLGWSDTQEIYYETLLRTQPFAARNLSVMTRC